MEWDELVVIRDATVYEPEEFEPVLYDSKGRALVHDRSIGFLKFDNRHNKNTNKQRVQSSIRIGK